MIQNKFLNEERFDIEFYRLQQPKGITAYTVM